MEVLGAVASAATLAQIAVKGLEFLQKIPEIESNYGELCDELEFIETIIRVAHQTSTHSEKTTPMPGIQDQFRRIISTLTEISRGLDGIKAKCQHQAATGDVRVSKKKWMIFGGKIGGMLQKAHRAKTNLQVSIAMHMSTLHHQTYTELREVKRRLDILPGIESQLGHVSHAAMVMISTQEQMTNGQTEKHPQRIQELDDEGNELDSNDMSAITHALGPATPDAPPQSLVGPRTTLAVAFQKTQCPSQCVCRCHTRPRKVSSPEWLKKLAGSWELQYKPQPARMRWDTRCPCNKSDGLEIAWRPPEWWWIQSFFPRPHRYSLKCALRPVRVLSWKTDEYGYLGKSVADIRQAMDNGMVLFPDDWFDFDLNIIEILVLNRSFEVLDFLLLQWKNMLAENGLSRNTGYQASLSLRFGAFDEPEVRVLEQVVSYVDWETDVATSATSAIHEAAARGSGVPESCIGAKDLIDAWDETGYPPLHHAIINGHTQAVQDLIDAGADVNCKSFLGETPLMLAAVHGRTECMRRLLLTRAVRIDERNRFDENVMHHAASNGNPEAVRLLLEAGASTSLRSGWGRFPLHRAATSNNQNPAEIAATINLLLDAPGTNINATDDYGNTAIMLAVRHNKHVALRCLAQAGASFTAMNNSALTVLHKAARWGDLETLYFLDGQELTCINWKLPGKLSWSLWKWFIYRFDDPERKPDPAEMIAFVQLYRGIRDRDLAHDISLLKQTLAALDRNDEVEAHLQLSAIIQAKEAYRDEDSAGFYRGLRGNLSCGDKGVLLDNIQADLQDLRLEMETSPWDQDALDESESDESLSDSDGSLSDSDGSLSDSDGSLSDSDGSLSDSDEFLSDSEDFSEPSLHTESDAGKGGINLKSIASG